MTQFQRLARRFRERAQEDEKLATDKCDQAQAFMYVMGRARTLTIIAEELDALDSSDASAPDLAGVVRCMLGCEHERAQQLAVRPSVVQWCPGCGAVRMLPGDWRQHAATVTIVKMSTEAALGSAVPGKPAVHP